MTCENNQTSATGATGPPDRLDRVRKLLAKAEKALTPEEAEVYTEKAMQLMARHGIDEAVLHAADPQSRPDPIGATRIELADPYSAGKARLLGWTASAMRCRWVLHNARQGRVSAVTVFGFESDRSRVDLLYTSLLLQIATPLRTARPDDPGESVAAYRRSWLYGFAARIHDRITQAEQSAVTETAAAPSGVDRSGAELVLAARTDQVEHAYREHFGKLRRTGAPSTSGSGWARGAAAADKVDLGTTSKVGQAQRRSLPGR